MTKSKIVYMRSHNKGKLKYSFLGHTVSCNMHILLGWVCFQILGQKREIRINILHWLAIAWLSILDCFRADSSPAFGKTPANSTFCPLISPFHPQYFNYPIINIVLVLPHRRVGWEEAEEESQPDCNLQSRYPIFAFV